MRILICGSREGFTREDVHARIGSLALDTEIIVGGARGVDQLAEEICRSRGLPVTVLRADWETHGKRAGFLRNSAMLDLKPHMVIAFWNGTSKGTKHTMDEAMKRGIPVVTVRS